MVLKRVFRGDSSLWRVGLFGTEGSSDALSLEVLSEGGVATVCSNSSGGGVVTVSFLAFTKYCTLFSKLSPRSGGLSEVFLWGVSGWILIQSQTLNQIQSPVGMCCCVFQKVLDFGPPD